MFNQHIQSMASTSSVQVLNVHDSTSVVAVVKYIVTTSPNVAKIVEDFCCLLRIDQMGRPYELHSLETPSVSKLYLPHISLYWRLGPRIWSLCTHARHGRCRRRHPGRTTHSTTSISSSSSSIGCHPRYFEVRITC